MEKKISELNSASVVNANDLLVLNQGSDTKKVSMSVLSNSLNIPSYINISPVDIPSFIYLDSQSIPTQIDLVGAIPTQIDLVGAIPTQIDLVGAIPTQIDLVGAIPTQININWGTPPNVNISSIARLISPGPAQLADDIVVIDQLLVACFHPSEIDVIDPSIVNLMICPISTAVLPVNLGVSYKVIMNNGVSYGLHDFSLNNSDWRQIASMNNTNECIHANVIDKTNDVIYKITAQLKSIGNLTDSDTENDADTGKVYVLVERSYARPSIP